MIEFINYLLTNPVVTALLGTLFGGFIAYCFSLRLNSLQRKQIAAQKLRDAFAREKAILDPQLGNKDENAVNILEEALPKHIIAVSEYRIFLNTKEKKEFDKAWLDYYSANGDDRCAWFTQYEIGQSSRELFIQRWIIF